MKLKAGVRIRGLRPEMVMGHMIVASCYDAIKVECIVTSANDSSHGNGSLHFTGAALDYRTKNVPLDKKGSLAQTVKSSIGGDFDVILEGLGTPNEHLHVEYQPKTA